MSFVTTQPEALAAAAANLRGIGSGVDAQSAAAAAPTTGVVPAAADEVSALTAAQFAAHGQLYQAVSAQATAIHKMFVNALSTSGGSYAATEAANSTAPASLSEALTSMQPYASFAYNTEGLPYFSVGMGNSLIQAGKALAPAAAAAAPPAVPKLTGLGAGLGAPAASLGGAQSVGRLSVPAAWGTAAPGLSHAADAPMTVSTVGLSGGEAGGNVVGGVPMTGAAGQGSRGWGPKYGFRSVVMARPPSAG